MDSLHLMDIIRYFILGLIQGFTEPIPVSSSGHLNHRSASNGHGTAWAYV